MPGCGLCVYLTTRVGFLSKKAKCPLIGLQEQGHPRASPILPKRARGRLCSDQQGNVVMGV